jgi:hypothetical protein
MARGAFLEGTEQEQAATRMHAGTGSRRSHTSSSKSKLSGKTTADTQKSQRLWVIKQAPDVL